jgi:hypothetical protein
MNRNMIAIALALAALAAPASAHRPWLYPQQTMVEARETWVTVDGVVSEGLFDVDHVAFKLDKAVITGPDGRTLPTPVPLNGRQRSSIDLRLPVDGTYRISVINRSVTASYKDAKGELKRLRTTEENLAREVPAGAAELKTTRLLQRIETFVSANKHSDGALKPSGSGLEFAPLTNPTDLRSGETARWRFTLDGKPLANFAFSLTPGGVKYRGVLGEVRLATGANGEVEVKLPAPGMYYLNAVYPPAPAAREDAPAQSEARRYSYAATLEILPD